LHEINVIDEEFRLGSQFFFCFTFELYDTALVVIPNRSSFWA